MIIEVSDAIGKTISHIVDTILPQLFTLDTIVLMSVIVIITETVKQAVKGDFGTKYLKIDSLKDYQIRLLTIILGISFSTFYSNTPRMRDRVMLGIFYGGLSVVLYAIIKKYFLRRVSPEIENKLSGQNKPK